MKGPTHLTIGILSAIEVSILIQKPLTPTAFVFASVCSLLPDIDESNSIISNTLITSSFSKKFYRYLLYLINMITFFILIYINNNLMFNFIISFILIIVMEKKLKHALLRKSLFSLIFFILSLSLYYIKIPFPFISLCIFLGIAPWLKHRGFTHSILGIGVIYYLLKDIEKIIGFHYSALYGCIGYSSHLFLGDLFTKMGIPLFYPIWDKKISLGFIKVGSISGNIFEFLYVIFFLILVLYTLKFKGYF